MRRAAATFEFTRPNPEQRRIVLRNAFPEYVCSDAELPARTAYEISKLEDETQQRAMLFAVSTEGLTNQQVRNLVRVKRGKRALQKAGTKLTFKSDAEFDEIFRLGRKHGKPVATELTDCSLSKCA